MLTSIRIGRVAAALTLLLLSTDTLAAQDTVSARANVAPAANCWRGKPMPACKTFLITEIGFHYRMLRPSRTVSFPGGVGLMPYTQKRQAASKFITAELGAMNNVGQRTAFGLTLSFAGENGNIGSGFDASVGVKARYRRWLASDGVSFEVGAGVESREDLFALLPRRSAGLTADVAINANDHIAAVLRYDHMRVDGRSKPALSFGVRPGAQAGFFTAASIAVTGLLAALLVSGIDP